MSTNIEALRRAVTKKGSAASLAQAIDVAPQFLSQILAGDRPLPKPKAVLVERETGVMRWDLFPTCWWEHWPELAKEPGAPAVPAATTASATT